MGLILKNRFLIKGKYKGNSKFSFWKDLREDDIIEISTILESNRGYQPTALFMHDMYRFSCSFTNLAKYINNMEVEEIGYEK